MRPGVTARAGQPLEGAPCPVSSPAADKPPERPRSPASYLWAALIARLYECLPLTCPTCGAEMRLFAFLAEPASLEPVLVHLGLSAEPPPLRPARGPPLDDLDHTPTFDLSAPAPAPEYEFDQTVSW